MILLWRRLELFLCDDGSIPPGIEMMMLDSGFKLSNAFLALRESLSEAWTRFLAQFFPLGRITKLRNDILMFQQHQGESLSEAWTRFKDLLQKVPHHGIDLWLKVQIFYYHVTLITRRTIDPSAGGKIHDRNAEESWALLEDLALYDNESWNDPRDFAKPVKATSLPQDVPSTSDRHLIELENQVQRLMEAHLALTQPTQMNKITSSCEICSGPHDTQYCMENPEQAFVEYASSRTDEAGYARLSKFKADFKRQQSEMTNKIDTVLKAITDRMAGALPSDTVKNPKLNISPVSSARSYPTKDPQCSTHTHVKKNDDSRKEGPEAGGLEVEYFDIFPTQSELAYHKYLMYGPIPSIFLRNPIITEGWNFTYVMDCMIVEDISSIIDPWLSQVVLGKPFIEISNMTHDPPKRVVRFINGTNEIAYKRPHKIERYNSLSDLEKEHTKSVYLRNEEDKRRGVEKFLIKNEEEIFTVPGDDVGIKTSRLQQCRKVHLLEDKQIPSVGVFDEVFSTWMTFGGNTRDLGSFGEETDKITDLHQIHEEVLFIERGDGVAGIKQRRRDLSNDGVRDLATTSRRGRLKEDLESYTKRRRNFSLKNEEEIFTDAGDGVRIYPDGITSPAM
ncbi:MAK10-like protein [Tanacetum coccineum]|uniref:MAK10-like protein n=1 Tax=Tanacetum coccineum TaxID=301880 RepID=A0ABQ5EFL7_9ASTR